MSVATKADLLALVADHRQHLKTFSVHEYLQHMLDEPHYLLNQAQGLDKEVFLHDEMLKRAFVRLGEAAKQCSPRTTVGSYIVPEAPFGYTRRL